MKKLTLVSLIVFTLISFNSYAHKDHGAAFEAVNISQEQAIYLATKKVAEKIKANDIKSSWNSVESKTAVLERMNGRQVWKVSFNQINDDSNEVLNVLLSKTGSFISINESP